MLQRSFRKGKGNALALASGIKLDDSFAQTMFSPTFTHYPANIPCDTSQVIEAQVKQSVEQTFSSLKLDYVNPLILHVPYLNDKDTQVAWKVLETLAQLHALYETATIKPVIVQSRFYRETRYDFQLWAFCKDHGIVYQAFWMLKNNLDVLESNVIASLACYLMILCLGDIQVLNGTTKTEKMTVDLKAVADILGEVRGTESSNPFQTDGGNDSLQRVL
ncbi:NADP-dependent oxidoreductase domain-containing protein [Xylaria arbuscula]|nr:NADP-dependent oxidoreductase domain-containing protein [Xylaria arbuscula]